MSKGRVWTGRVLTGLALAFLVMDVVMKFVGTPGMAEICAHLGWAVNKMPVLGVVLGLCTVLYAIPRTAVLGAVLLTGYLGGAVATHMRVDDPLWSNTLFPIYIGVAIWAALWLRGRVSGCWSEGIGA